MNVRALLIVNHVLCVLLGIMAVLMYQTNISMSSLADKTKKLEGDVRTQLGRVYDLQEKGNEELDDAQGKVRMLQWKLDQCKPEIK